MGNMVGCRSLAKEDILFLEKHTRYDVPTLRRKHAEFRRQSPSGKLLPTQFRAMYSVFFPHHSADDFCRHVFRTFDLNQDGVVDFREYMLALHTITSGSPEEKLSWAFRLFDIDSNGVIEAEEVTEIARAVLSIVAPSSEALGPGEVRARARARAKQIFREMEGEEGRGQGGLSQGQFVGRCLRKASLGRMLAHSDCLVTLLTPGGQAGGDTASSSSLQQETTPSPSSVQSARTPSPSCKLQAAGPEPIMGA